MPMTLLGLQVVGLNDWPAWYRPMNPSYFAAGVSKSLAKKVRSTGWTENGLAPGMDVVGG
jgi:hypothetical protein